MLREPNGTESQKRYREHSLTTPIFILGTFHSATTILYRMLAMHPDTTWVSQLSLRDGSIPERRRVPLCRYIDRISRRLSVYDWQKADGGWRDLLVARPTEGQLIWQHIIPPSGSLEAAESVKRLRRILELESRGNKRFLVKYPYLTLHIPILRATYPQAKFVHIVRDGRAVSLSLKVQILTEGASDYIIRDGKAVPKSAHPITVAREHAPAGSDQEALTRAAHYWLQCIRMIQAEKDHIDLYEIRYEDFCADVHGHLAKLLEATGLEAESFPFHRFPSTLTPTNESWIQAASPDELETLETLLGDELRLYSYL